jgi:hypothetical protein
MRPLRLAVVVGWAALAACRSTTPAATATDPKASQENGPTARELAAVGPEFLPAFAELQRALAAGDDVVASRILRGIMARAPTGAALHLAQAFERVLAGREAVAELRLALVVRASSTPSLTNGSPASAASGRSTNASSSTANSTNENSAKNDSTTADSSNAGAPPDATSPRMEARLVLVVENTAAVPIELRPGPGNLRVTKTSVSRLKLVQLGEPMLGGEQQSSETHPYAELRNLALEPGASREFDLARFFIDVQGDDLAVRLDFDLELRSGSVVRDGRELPAMNVPVKGCEATRWSKLRYPEAEATPEALATYALRTTTITADCALEMAVRIPDEDRARALDLLAVREKELSEVHLTALVPALRWLTQDPTLGGDSVLWRAYLRARAGAKPKQRAKLELPARTE